MPAISPNTKALIIGATQGIGLGFVKNLLKQPEITKVYATYRNQASAAELFTLERENLNRMTSIPMDITEESQISAGIDKIKTETQELHLVINCVGILHDSQLQPEKSLREINKDNLLKYFEVNSIGSILLAKHLLPLLKHHETNVFAVISAKIGSIGDNNLGGWYGYRASKTALNMFMRTVSIEYSRKSPKTIVLMLHPGTTDTQLSQPFQRNVPPEKLFSVDRTVKQLLEVISQRTTSDNGKFFSWDGQPLPW